ncbi:MAG: TolC family outer membrane protein [Gammaproteobacteria bacterium]
MRKSAIVSSVLAATGLLCLATAAASAMSLKDAVRRATMEHPAIGRAVSNQRAIGYEVLQAQGRFLPTVDLSADIGAQIVHKPASPPPANRTWLPQRRVGLTVGQILYDGADRVNDVYAHSARFDAATLRVLQAGEFRALQAVEAYIDMRRHAIVLKLAQQNEARHRQILSIVRSIVGGGRAPRSDVSQVEQRLASAQAIVVQVERLLGDTRAKFKEAVGIYPGKISRVRLPGNMPKSIPHAISLAEKHNPQLLAAKVDIEAVEFRVEQSKSAYAPQIGLQGYGSYGEDIDGIPGDNRDFSGTVTLTWNLYNGNIKDNRVKELQERVSEAEYNYALEARQISEAVERAYNDFVLGRKRANVLDTEVAASRRVVAAYTEEYKLSKRSLLDLLDSEASLFNARFQWTNTYSLYVFAAYKTLATTGMLLPHFGLNRPVVETGGVRSQAQQDGVFNITLDPLQ